MKILYVSQYFPPEMGAPAARVAELSRIWTEMGHQVTVLTGFPNHPTGVVPREYRGKLRRLVIREKIKQIDVVRTWLLPLPNRKAHERMLSYSSFCASSAATGLFLPRPDVVIATSPQLLVGLSGWWLARAKGARFVLEVRDLWPESLAAVGMGTGNSWLYRILLKVAGFLYRESDQIVVVTSAFKKHLVEQWRIPEEKIFVVENGVETEIFSPRQPSARLRQELGAEGKFLVSYVGTLGLAHGLETLLEAASRLRYAAPEILFLLAGEGSEKQRLASMAQTRNLTNLRFVDQQPHAEIPAYICASDTCLVLLKKAELFKIVLPTKLLEFMSCARPVIVSVDGETRDIVDKANAGIFVEPGNPIALADAVLYLAGNPAVRETFGRNGRHFVLQNFTRQHTATAYLALLTRLLGDSQTPIAAAA